MPNPVVHFEIQSSGTEELHKFYADLFEWHIDASNPMGYGVVDTHTEKGINGGTGATNGGPISTIGRTIFEMWLGAL